MKKILLIISSIIISLLTVEVFLKILNFKKFEFIEIKGSSMVIPHKILGWVTKGGANIINHEKRIYEKIIYTYEDLGNKKKKKKKNNDKNSILVFGGSFTQGWGVNDNKTFTSRMQESLKELDVYNFGHAGYSGYQSLLLMEDRLKKIKSKKLIIYGFIEHHEQRNVARASWLRLLAQISNPSGKEIPKVPYVALDKNKNLIRKKPISYTKFILSEKFITIYLMEKFYMKQISKKRKKYQRKATNKIFLEMKDLSLENNVNFLVVVLDWSNKLSNEKYMKFFTNNKINFINCKIDMNKETLLKNDYHPNERGHYMYKECILNYINKSKLFF